MNRLVLVGMPVVAVFAAAVWYLLGSAPAGGPAEARATMLAYCIDCHNDAEFAGNVSFEAADPGALHANIETWEKAVRKLEAGLMPPAGEPRPPHDELESLTAWLTTGLDELAARNPNPGAPALHRLNRTEYANAIRDLLALDIDVTTLLPADDSREGFDNIADALSVSPAHMQAYVSAAASISRLAIGDVGASPGGKTYSVPRGLSQAGHLEGLPFGTRGGLAVEHVFPVDAEYEISVRRALGGIFLDSVGNDDPVEVAIDGRRLAVFTGRGGEPIRIPVTAGPHRLTAAVLPRGHAYGVDDLFSNLAASTGVSSISIIGPFDTTGAGDTPSRQRVLVCAPDAAADAGEERACAREIVSALARRAFRRPVGELEDSIETIMGFFDEGHALGGFDLGVQHALARVLVDPQFIYRFEYEPDGVAPGGVYAIDDHALATRLGFFLWSSLPDDRLLDLADAGRLGDPAVRRAEVERLLGDARALALTESFAVQWLGLRVLETVNPVGTDFDANLRTAMARETQLLFADIVERDGSVLDLLDADYTFVNERLARHYGIRGVRGSRFRRVTLTDPNRFGLLGHASILTTTSSPTRTSPVIRGAWVLEHLLGTPPPSPPPGVETNLDESVPERAGPDTLRARLERHREDPGCASCHNIIDPIGFALESFDLTGRWRETDRGEPIDARGELWDGTPLDGPASLREVLTDRETLFVQALAERLLTYALGRSLEAWDMPAVRGIAAAAAADDYRFSALVNAIVESAPFRLKRAEDPANVAALNRTP